MFELWLVSLIVIAIGIVGTVVPGLPGMPLLLGGIALFSLGTELRIIGPFQFGLFIALGLLGLALNYVGHLLGARKFGASRMGLLGAVLGLIPGLLLAGPFGLIIGPLAGAVAFELMRGRELAEALRSGFGVLVGYLFGALAEVVIALGMAAWFVWSTWGTVTAGFRLGLL
jgi:uncharacterized protein YqgC (DUF456 family)